MIISDTPNKLNKNIEYLINPNRININKNYKYHNTNKMINTKQKEMIIHSRNQIINNKIVKVCYQYLKKDLKIKYLKLINKLWKYKKLQINN